jgi:hypothetical protein
MALISPYLQYITLYLGIALIGGAIVHMPVDPFRFGMLGVVGFLLFVMASYIEGRKKQKEGTLEVSFARYLGLSFLLSLGVGMLSGSIQHFLDTPTYAAKLIPIGIILAFFAYAFREHKETLRTAFKPLVIVTIFSLVLGAGLHYVAYNLEHIGHDGHSHSH